MSYGCPEFPECSSGLLELQSALAMSVIVLRYNWRVWKYISLCVEMQTKWDYFLV